jgi:hypothetical protein
VEQVFRPCVPKYRYGITTVSERNRRPPIGPPLVRPPTPRLENEWKRPSEHKAVGYRISLTCSLLPLSFHPGIGFELAELFIPLLEVAKTVGSELQEL